MNETQKEKQREKLIGLIIQAQQGNQDAFEQLCHEKGQSILYICIQTMGNLHDGEDAAQEVFIRMQKGIKTLQEPKAFSGWLHKLIINTCRDMGRKKMKDKYNTSIEDMGDIFIDENETFIPQGYLEIEEKRNRLLDIIDGLPKNYRLSIVLFYFEGLSYEEIAEAMDVNVKAVSNYLYRAKEAIRKEIEKEDEENRLAAFAIPMLPLGEFLRKDAAAKVTTEMINRVLSSSIAGAGLSSAVSKTVKASAKGGISGVVVATAAALTLFGTFTIWQMGQNSSELPISNTSESIVSSSQVISSEVSSSLEEVRPESSAVSSAPSVQESTPVQEPPPATVYGVISGRAYFSLPNDTAGTSQGAESVSLSLVQASNTSIVVKTANIDPVSGNFFFENVPLGQYNILVNLPTDIRTLPNRENSTIVNAQGQVLLAVNGNALFEITAGQTNIDYAELPLNYAVNVEGYLAFPSPLSATPMVGITVELFYVSTPGSAVSYYVQTNENGYFFFENVIVNNPSEWGLRFTRAGVEYMPANIGAGYIQLTPGRSMQVSPIVLQPSPFITFQYVEGSCSCDTCQDTARRNPGNVVVTITNGNMPVSANLRIESVLSSTGTFVYEEVWDITSASQNTHVINIPPRIDPGEYVIIISAQDSLGNSTGDYRHPVTMIIEP